MPSFRAHETYPHRKAKQMRLEKYREAWQLMKLDLQGSQIKSSQ